uniref:Uncharacterized protein n=1 Tax=Anopheles farauti TaxID=69004 RepID=A0A182R0R5_9DIPT
MEEPDRGAAAKIEAVVDDSSDKLTASLSSEGSDSWTLLGKGNGDPLNKEPSGVQEIVKEDEPQAEEESNETKEKSQSVGKQRHDSHRSTDSQLDESSDGISVISESDAVNYDKLPVEEDSNDERGYRVRFRRNIDLHLPNYVPLTPPFTPDEVKSAKEEPAESKRQLQVQQNRNDSIEPVNSVVEHTPPASVSSASWILFGLLATAMAAVILGNSMRLQHRVDEVNFEHEKRISELELENNILKNEMNKLRHLYTRSELDEQVQRAEFEWMDVLRQEAMTEPVDEGIPEPIPEVEPVAEAAPPLQPTVRKVPPQDGGVKRKVVWSGDEEEPMLIVDKDYVLPAFCYNQDKAVQDDLFSEYSAKYCDVKKRKIEAKQRKSEFQQKKQPKQENYNKFIHSKAAGNEQQGPIEPGKLASPFNIDYKKAFDAIKAEGSVIVEALGSILDLSPEPEETVRAKIDEVIPPDSDVRPEQFKPVDNPASDHFANVQNGEPEAQRQENRRHDDHRPAGKHERYEKDEYRSSEGKEHNKRKDDSYRAADDKGRKQKKGREGSGEGKERQQGYRERDSYEHKKYEAGHGYDGDRHHEKNHNRNKHNDRQNSENYKRKSHHDDDDDDDEDDHYRKKFDHHEKSKDYDHKHHRNQRNTKQWKQGSGERPKHVQASDEDTSYLNQYKREEGKRGKQHGSGDHHKQHKQDGYKHGDWNEKRSKGRDEYRQGSGKHRDRGSGEGHWQERMKHGRQEARDEQRKQMDHESNWYLERGNQREEERLFPQQPAN